MSSHTLLGLLAVVYLTLQLLVGSSIYRIYTHTKPIQIIHKEDLLILANVFSLYGQVYWF